MKCHIICLLFIILLIFIKDSYTSTIFKKPTALIGILARNKAHVLPYSLSLLENLNYPKNRLALWIHSDNNIDNTIEVLETWLNEQSNNYFSVNVTLDRKNYGHEDEKSFAEWSPKRFEHIIKLRENILNYARRIWADYVFMLDVDVFLTNVETLDLLISKNKTIVAPLLKSDGLYSNFWAGMSSDFYYKRTDDYEPILTREKIGCFSVPMVHSAVLIDLKRTVSDSLTYDSENLSLYNGPRDDIITFALGANISGVKMHICNDEPYGFIMVPLDNQDTIDHDYQQLLNIKLEMLATEDQESIVISNVLKRFIQYPKKDKLGFSNVYMINLVRRPERRRRMLTCFNELGISVEIVDAVDGRTLNESLLNAWNIKMMPSYEDPYHKRPMTMGEVGCFLSHYIVWNRIVEDEHSNALVLEDDVRFEPYFRQKVQYILQELEKFQSDYDLVYVGRKRMQKDSETRVEGSKYLVYAGYSYWTVGYLLSAKGAKKLIDAKPLENLVPVDEYLPIMYNQHPRDDWKGYYENRNLIALSAEPLIIFPTHYTGDSGYISDTENSVLISTDTSDSVHEKEEL
ncbi:glycosyltransferase 25 family member [Phymastichus coffea]|uniref:glycosyltransferase 25 family member n=1 Tax=Phymastichus coffea TaxID=108790 RepID=UPI00273BD3C0|nr:glycosyltransferase 25 family member [Phymastichus coffea]